MSEFVIMLNKNFELHQGENTWTLEKIIWIPINIQLEIVMSFLQHFNNLNQHQTVEEYGTVSKYPTNYKRHFKTSTTCRVVVDALNVSDAIVPLVQTRSSPKIAWNIDNYYQTSIHWYKHFSFFDNGA